MASSFTDHIRLLTDDELSMLVRLRPDLIIPVPADFAALGTRAQSRVSVGRALDGLNQFTLQVLDALRMTCTDGVACVPTVLEMAAQSGVADTAVLPAIEALTQRLLVYGDATAPTVVPTVEEVSSPYLTGLGRPAVDLGEDAALLAADPARLRRTLLAAPPPARAALDRLAAGPPIGTVSRASLAKGADSAVRWLVEAHLLVQISDVTVELPREIGLLLRRDTGPLGPLEPDPPAMATSHRDPAAVDQAAAGQALEMVRHTEALLEALSTEPAAMLRTGGVGVRDLRRLARAADVSEPVAALLIEVAWAAGLLGESSSQAGYAQYLPTVTYDGWRASGIATRWVRLASAWLGMSREPAVIGQRDDRRVVNALSNEVERVGASRRRGAVLDVLGSLPPGAVLDPEGIVAVLTWQEPRRATQASSAAAATTLTEAATLGLAGLDALSGFSRLLLTDPVASDDDPLGVRGGDPPGESSAVKTLDTLLPDPVDRILLQTDLSVVVPGPPEPALATELALLADQESPSVFRITPASVRRALDSGFSAGDLHTFLAKRSTTAVPQPVSYLINDVARRHGGLRAGSAGSYVHSDDKALIAEVAANRRLAALSLRRLAPTVITSPYPIVRLLAALRDAGYAPVAEDATGDAVLVRPKVRRAAARPAGSSRREDPLATPGPSTARINGTIDQIRKGDAAARAASRAPASVRTATRTGSPSPTDHAQALAVLQRAIRDNTLAWVGYVDAHGSPVSRLLRPVSMGGGFLRAEDERAETIHTFALHRITAAAING